MCRSRTGDWSVVIGPGLALALGLLYIFVYIFSFSSLVRVVANLRRCLHYHIILLYSGLPSKLRVSSCSNTMDVTMVTRVLVRYLHNSNVRRSSASSSRPAHTERFCLARRKISNKIDIFLTALRGRNRT